MPSATLSSEGATLNRVLGRVERGSFTLTLLDPVPIASNTDRRRNGIQTKRWCVSDTYRLPVSITAAEGQSYGGSFDE